MCQTIASPTDSSAVTRDRIDTIDELIKQRAAELGDATLIGYPKEEVTDYEEHSARAVDRYADAAAQALQRKGLSLVSSTCGQAPTVGILAQSSLHLIITTLSLSRLGYAVLLLSPRLAAPALSRLLELAKCDTLLTTSVFDNVLAQVREGRKVNTLDLLTREEYLRLDAPAIIRNYDPVIERQKHAVIIHSSGSTGLPKPIFLTHQSCIGAFAVNLNRRALITSPFFHSHCFYETFRSIYSCKSVYYCNHALPLTQQSVTAMLEHVKPDLFHCVPYILKLLSESERGVKALASVDFVLFAGSACPDDLGDALIKRGVNLNGNYGATEIGRLMTSERPSGDKAWNYLRILPQVSRWVLMDEIAPGLHECVALDGLKSKSTINSDDPPRSFRTRDLFKPHSTQPDLWKYVSRLDDRFTLVNGEKVLPIPIEGRIRQELSVQEAVVFGDGKSVPGVLVIKADREASTPDDDFLERIWPAVQDANSRAESFSQIPKELTVVLPAGTNYPRTDKGTFIRALVYTQFKEHIQAAYSRFETDEGGTLVLEGPKLEEFFLQRFEEHTGVVLESGQTDFFSAGVDSLQCIKMWSLIKKKLNLGGRQNQLSQNILYETGNVEALARYLENLRRGTVHEIKDENAVMKDLITKYSNFPSTQPITQRGQGRVVLLTGATGGLGAHLLGQLVARPDVSAVWSLVRADSDESALGRVVQSLKKRGISTTGENLSKIVALASDLSNPDFGLEDSRFNELRSNVIAVIHSAWAVNFNISVSSFEDQHVKAVHNLISLCRSTSPNEPTRFLFCSSVSAAGGTPRPGTVPESIVTDIDHVQRTGYARSKYVAEHITRNAMKDSGAAARNLRVGQLIGDTKTGEWSTNEGIPLMIQTSMTLGALPELDEEMSWLPVDVAASIILDLVFSKEAHGPDLVYHVLNPKCFHWTRDMLPALRDAGLKFETLPTDQWMERLRTSESDPAKNPPVKLLEWFEGKYGKGVSKVRKGLLVYETEQTTTQSPSMKSIPDITQIDFVKILVDRLKFNWKNDG